MDKDEIEVKPRGYYYQKYYKQKIDEDPEYRAKRNEINRKCMNRRYQNDEEFRLKTIEDNKKYYQDNKEYFRQYYQKKKEAKKVNEISPAEEVPAELKQRKAKVTERNKQYYQANKEYFREYQKQQYLKKKAANDASNLAMLAVIV